MKKSCVSLLVVACMATMTVAGASFAVSADEATPVNLVAGRSDIEFRDLEDVTKKIDMYSYFPDNGGINGTGCRYMTDTGKDASVLTDGSIDWGGYNVVTTAPKTMGWAYIDLGATCTISSIDVGYVAAWAYEYNIIQVSGTADFSSDVTTIYATSAFGNTPLVGPNGVTVYNGGLVSDSSDIIRSANSQYVYAQNRLETYKANNVEARYVRLTNLDVNTATDNNTQFTEIAVYGEYSQLPPDKVVPEAGASSVINYSQGMDYEFKSLDFTKTLTKYMWTPFLGGIDKTGVYELEGDYADWGKLITDGSLTLHGNSTAKDTVGWLTFDLGENKLINRIDYSGCGGFAYENEVIQISTTADFSSDVTTVFAHSENGNTPLVDENGKTIYDGSSVNIEGQTLSPNLRFLYNENRMQSIKFADTRARYVRMTNLQDGAVNGGADNNTFYTEVQIMYDMTADGKSLVDAIYYNKTDAAISKGGSVEGLFDKSVVLGVGDKKMVVDAEWVCENFDANVPGVYQFVCSPAYPDTVKNGYNLQAINTVTIKAENTITWTTEPADCDYGTELTFAATALAGEVTYTYKQGDQVLEGAPVNAGTYTVVATSASTELYDGATLTADFMIRKIDNEITLTSGVESKVYDGAANEFAGTANGAEVSVGYYVKGEATALEGAPVNAGEYTVILTAAANTNYNETVLTKDFVITKAQNTLAWEKEPADKVYDGKALDASATATSGEVTVTYYVGETTALEGNPVNAGEYTVTAVVAESENFVGATITKDVVITKANIAVSGMIYNGDVLYTSSAMPAADKFNYEAAVSGTLTITEAVLTEGVNTLTWTYTPADTTNYEAATGTVDVNVNAVSATGIVISALPAKIEYTDGDKLDLTGLVVEMQYNDGSKKAVTNYTADKETLTAADTEVVITCDGFTAKFNVTVTEKVQVQGGCSSSASVYGIALMGLLAAAVIVLKKSKENN